jgi:hypothetical protein
MSKGLNKNRIKKDGARLQRYFELTAISREISPNIRCSSIPSLPPLTRPLFHCLPENKNRTNFWVGGIASRLAFYK